MSAAFSLLEAGRSLLGSSGGEGWRPWAVATLTRQALEAGLDAYWAAVARGAEEANRTVQLLCLPVYAGADLGGLAFATWTALSSVCHVRAYDIAPTPDELARWADNVERVLDGLAVSVPV